jgi:hypothetical protein
MERVIARSCTVGEIWWIRGGPVGNLFVDECALSVTNTSASTSHRRPRSPRSIDTIVG